MLGSYFFLFNLFVLLFRSLSQLNKVGENCKPLCSIVSCINLVSNYLVNQINRNNQSSFSFSIVELSTKRMLQLSHKSLLSPFLSHTLSFSLPTNISNHAKPFVQFLLILFLDFFKDFFLSKWSNTISFYSILFLFQVLVLGW